VKIAISRGTKIFLTGWLVYSLHFATDISREHYPAFSLAERGTLRVDPYLGLHPDLFEVPGRGAFINNNPGASIVGGLAYAPARPLVDLAVGAAARHRPTTDHDATYRDDRPMRREFFRRVRDRGLDVRFGLAAGVIQLLGFAPLCAAALVCMFSLLVRLGFSERQATGLALLYGFGTPVFFRAAFLNHNLLVAHALLFAFALLQAPGGRLASRARLFAAGGVVGSGLLCDYAGSVPVVALGSYTLARLRALLPWRSALVRMLWMVAGAALPVGGLLVYQQWAFGNPFLPAQYYMPATQFSVEGWKGFDWPSPDLLLRNLFDRRYGFFAFGPLMALAFAAPRLDRPPDAHVGRPERVLAYGLFVALLVFTSANQFDRLQWITGFRMLAPALPLLFLLVADSLVRLPRRLVLAIAGLAVFHSWCIAMVRADAIESVRVVLTQGPRLPWLTSMWRAGDSYLSFLPQTGPQAWPVLLVGAVLLAWVWTRPTPARARGHLGSGLC